MYFDNEDFDVVVIREGENLRVVKDVIGLGRNIFESEESLRKAMRGKKYQVLENING